MTTPITPAVRADLAPHGTLRAGVNYGNFIQTTVDFLIVACAIFMVVKALNAMKRKQEAAPATPPAPTKDQVLLTEIRDLLKAR